MATDGDAARHNAANRHGTQAIERAVLILRLMTRCGPAGWRLSELSRACGLNHATSRRILKCLVDERLVDRDCQTGRYRLGPLNFELGLACQQRLDFRDRIRPTLERIARQSGDTVYLHIRSGLETVCIDRVDGSFPIRAITLEIGGRRPLGFGSIGLAMLALLEEAEVTRIIDSLALEIANNPRITKDSLLHGIAAARIQGYGIIRDTTVLGVSAIGMALPPQDRIPMVGVGLAMVSDRLSPSRVKLLRRLIGGELDNIQRQLSDQRAGA